MQTAIIVVGCLIGVFAIWYTNMMDFFYPKDCSPYDDPEIVEWEKKKAAHWTKHY